MFEAVPNARADLKPGTVYAVAGEGGWVYFGQVAPDKSLAFFRDRALAIALPGVALASPVMAIVDVAHPSITRALRSGRWTKLGRFAIAESLNRPRMVVQWPVGTLKVTVWLDGVPAYETSVDDIAIQSAELMAVWDAEAHIPQRLTADFGAEPAEWHVGGPIWRERRVKEEMARRHPDASWHRLPPDWVPTSVR